MILNGKEISSELFQQIRNIDPGYHKYRLVKIDCVDYKDISSDLRSHIFEGDDGNEYDCYGPDICLGMDDVYYCDTCGYECDDYAFEDDHELKMRDDIFHKCLSKIKFAKYVERLKSV